MSTADALRYLAAIAERTWNGSLSAHVSADEVANALGETGPRAAQRTGSTLALLERRGLVESKREDWGKMWRLAEPVRELLVTAGVARA